MTSRVSDRYCYCCRQKMPPPASLTPTQGNTSKSSSTTFCSSSTSTTTTPSSKKSCEKTRPRRKRQNIRVVHPSSSSSSSSISSTTSSLSSSSMGSSSLSSSSSTGYAEEFPATVSHFIKTKEQDIHSMIRSIYAEFYRKYMSEPLNPSTPAALKEGLSKNYVSLLWGDGSPRMHKDWLFEHLVSRYDRAEVTKDYEAITLDELIRKTDFYFRLKNLFAIPLAEESIREALCSDILTKIQCLASERFFLGITSEFNHKKAMQEDFLGSNCIFKLARQPLLVPKMDHLRSKISGMVHLKLRLFFEVLCPIFDKNYFQNYAQPPPNGILFFGPPGCGKTLFATTLAEATEAEFVQYSPGSHGSPYVNETSIKIHALFEKAEKKFKETGKFTVIFFDEMESVVPNRESIPFSHVEKQNSISQFLTLMESCSKRGILLVGATNLRERIDPAAIRPGRFDREYSILPPSEETIAALLKDQLNSIPFLDKYIDIQKLLSKMRKLTPASVKAVVQFAANSAAQTDSPVTEAHLYEGITQVLAKDSQG